MDVYVIHVLSARRAATRRERRSATCRLRGRRRREITVSRPLLDRYERTLRHLSTGARDFCTRRGMSYVLANNEIPVEQLVTSYLRSRGLVR